MEVPGRPRKPPNRILLNTNSPSACQNVIVWPLNTLGASQFQRPITTKLKTVTASAANTANFNPLRIQRRFIFRTSSSCELVVDFLQPQAQMKNRVAFA